MLDVGETFPGAGRTDSQIELLEILVLEQLRSRAFEDNPASAFPQVTREELMQILPREYQVNALPAADPAAPFFGLASDDLRAIGAGKLVHGEDLPPMLIRSSSFVSFRALL